MRKKISIREAPAEIRSEARGPHWIAWVVGSDSKPLKSVVLVGETRQEAEARARNWAARAQEGTWGKPAQ